MGCRASLLQSVEDEKPDFNLIGLAHAAARPGVRRKRRDMGAAHGRQARVAGRRQLNETGARIAGAR